MQNPSALLTQRLAALGAVQPIDFLDRFAPAIRSWLVDLLRDQMPAKEDVMRWIGDALRQVLDSTEFPIADDFLDVAIREAILTIAGAAYDQLVATNRPAI